MERRQNLSLGLKETFTALRIREWYEFWDGKVYVSFSGGKDSTVLLHQVRRIYPEVPAVFIDTGLEYPEIREFVKGIENVAWVRPKIPFMEVIEKWGFPVVSKEVSQKIYDIRNSTEKLKNKRLYGDEHGHGKLSKKWLYLVDAPFRISDYCCDVMKKKPAKLYEKKTGRNAFIGTMAYESHLRRSGYLVHGCNSFVGIRPISKPMGFWLEHDIYDYLTKYNLKISSIYNMGYTRTGCMFCMFGVHHEDGLNRFQKMKETHPKQWKFCMHKLGCGVVLDYIGIPY